MANSKTFSSIFLVISSLVFVGFAQQGGGGGGSSSSLPCVQKLLPCQASLVSHSKSPPASCCIPLKQIIASDPKCLCQFVNNSELLKDLNITQHDALDLAKACNTNADISICKTVAGPPTVSPGTPSTPSKSNSSSTTSPAENAAAAGVAAGLGESVAISFALFLALSAIGSI